MRRSLIRASLLAAEPRIEIVETQPGTWKVAAYPPLPIIHHCSHPPSSCPHQNAPLVKFYYEKPSMSEEIQRAEKLWEATVMQALPLSWTSTRKLRTTRMKLFYQIDVRQEEQETLRRLAQKNTTLI